MSKPNAFRFPNLFDLSTGELIAIQSWAAEKHESFPHFGRWLMEVCVAELGKRQQGESEPGDLEWPTLTGEALADFMLGSLVFSNMPVTENIGNWIDEVHKQATCSASSVLCQYFSEATTS